GTASFRKPDGLNAAVIQEVKNVAYQALTNQLKDSLAWAQQKGLTFELFVRFQHDTFEAVAKSDRQRRHRPEEPAVVTLPKEGESSPDVSGLDGPVGLARERRLRAYKEAALPVVRDLARAGFNVSFIADLYNSQMNYAEAVPLLIRWLPDMP